MVLNKEEVGTLGEAIGVALWQFVILIVIIMGLFLFGGIEIGEFFDKSVFYGVIGSISSFAIFALGLVDYLVLRGNLSERVWGWGKLYLHNPKEGILGMFFDTFLGGKYSHLKEKLTFWNIFHFAVIFGLAISLYGAVSQTFFIGLPPAEFQVTTTGKIILETEPAALTETLLLVALTSIFYGVGKWILIDKLSVEEASAILLMMFLTVIFIALFWLAFHSQRYGTDQVALSAVIAFAVIGMLITFIIGSFIPLYIWHVFNNAFLKSTELFSSEGVVAVILAVLIGYAVTVVLVKFTQFALNKTRG